VELHQIFSTIKQALEKKTPFKRLHYLLQNECLNVSHLMQKVSELANLIERHERTGAAETLNLYFLVKSILEEENIIIPTTKRVKAYTLTKKIKWMAAKTEKYCTGKRIPRQTEILAEFFRQLQMKCEPT